MTTVGEPIQPEAWLWYYTHIGDEDAVIVDTWWQTETGGHLITNLPAIHDMKPGSAGNPCPGIEAALYDNNGTPLEPASGRAGNLVIERPWPGMLQTVYGDDRRFINEYWRRFSDTDSDDWRDWVYEAGDGAVHEKDGYFRILGRLDDVMNVAGHRLGTMELESAVAQVADVAEAAVAAREDDQKGHVPDVYVTVREGVEASEEVRQSIVAAVEHEIGKFARPANVIFLQRRRPRQHHHAPRPERPRANPPSDAGGVRKRGRQAAGPRLASLPPLLLGSHSRAGTRRVVRSGGASPMRTGRGEVREPRARSKSAEGSTRSRRAVRPSPGIIQPSQCVGAGPLGGGAAKDGPPAPVDACPCPGRKRGA
jgi:acyl-CoA synthetase (AMP-forming)/AMP-acid ligase II